MRGRIVNAVISALLLISVCINVFLFLDNRRISSASTTSAVGTSSDALVSSDVQSSVGRLTLRQLAEIPDEGVKLYGVEPYGAMLYMDDKGYYMDWKSVTNEVRSIDLNLADYNLDGESELSAVISNQNSESGEIIDELHVITMTDVGNQKLKLSDRTFTATDVVGKFSPLLNVKQSTDMSSITVTFNKQDFSSDAAKIDSGYRKVAGLTAGRSVEFEYDRLKITVKMSVGVAYDETETAQTVGHVTANVNFYDNKFTVSSYEFAPLSAQSVSSTAQ